jgi:hypothetical protein
VIFRDQLRRIKAVLRNGASTFSLVSASPEQMKNGEGPFVIVLGIGNPVAVKGGYIGFIDATPQHLKALRDECDRLLGGAG